MNSINSKDNLSSSSGSSSENKSIKYTSSGDAPPYKKNKHQYRFRAKDDFYLLKKVEKYDPYRSKHGKKTETWKKIVDELSKDHGIDVKVRRCKERVATLLSKFRNNELSVFRKNSTPDEYEYKIRILSDILKKFAEKIYSQSDATFFKPTVSLATQQSGILDTGDLQRESNEFASPQLTNPFSAQTQHSENITKEIKDLLNEFKECNKTYTKLQERNLEIMSKQIENQSKQIDLVERQMNFEKERFEMINQQSIKDKSNEEVYKSKVIELFQSNINLLDKIHSKFGYNQ